MITADLIVENLAASSKKQAFKLLSEQAAGLFFGNPADVFDALMAREQIGSTGIGCGVAIPHIKLPNLKKMYGVMARLEQPVDYDSIDEKPVDIIFMILAPAENKMTQHLKALADISRFLKDAQNCAQIRCTASRGDLSTLINDWLKKNQAA